MKHIHRIARLMAPCTLAACAAFCGAAHAAPLDTLLEANPQARYGQGLLEVSADRMNQSLDVFKLRGADLALGENTGNYQGGTLRAGLSLAPTVWVDGALQRRKLTYGPDQPKIDSWRLGAQWQFLPAQAGQASAALRLSAWGNQAAQVSKSTPTALGPLNCSGSAGCVDRLSVNDAKDRTLQADVVGTWPLGAVSLSAFAGAGQGKVTVDSITATASQVPLLGNATSTYRNGSFDNTVFAIASNLFNFNTELQSTNYSTRMAQAGFNLAYTSGPWSLRGGYALQHIQRSAVDDVIRAKGKTAYSLNHTLVGELAYKVSPRVVLFSRGQAMSNQFLTEIPFLYNSLTSQRFNQRYGVLSFGVGAVFD
jgi:hypothetical protein